MNPELHDEIERLAREFAGRVTRLVADAIVTEVQDALSRGAPKGVEGGGAPSPASRAARRLAAAPLDRWIPDRRARRVPRFVIEATGLERKAAIIERYGEHAIFERGQPAPPPLKARGGAEA